MDKHPVHGKSTNQKSESVTETKRDGQDVKREVKKEVTVKETSNPIGIRGTDPNLPKNLDSLVRPVAKAEGDSLYHIPVSLGKMMDEMATYLYDTVFQLSINPIGLDVEDFRDTFRYLLAARCAQVSGIGKTETNWRDIEYPSFLFPVLSSIGMYTDTSTNLTIVPVVEIGYAGVVRLNENGELDVFGKPKLEFNRRAYFRQPDSYDKVIMTIRSYGVDTGRGLPKDREIENDDLFRLEISSEAVYGHRKAPSAVVLYTRALLEMAYLAHLFGETRVMYMALTSVRSSIHELVARHVTGTSRVVRAAGD